MKSYNQQELAQKAGFIGALLADVPDHDKRFVVNRALAVSDRAQGSVLPIHEGIPVSADPQVARKLVNGALAQLFAISMSGPDTPVSRVLAMADSMVTGKPMTGDPSRPADSGSATLAKALLQAAAISPEVASRLTDDPELVKVLNQIVAEMDDAPNQAIPMSGAPNGFFNKLWEGIKEGGKRVLTSAAGAIGSEVSKEAAIKQAEADLRTMYPDMPEEEIKRQALMTIGGGIAGGGTSLVFNPSVGRFQYNYGSQSGIDNAISQSLAQLRQQMTIAMGTMQQSITNTEVIKQAAMETARDSARITWAHAILSSPESVANLLMMVDPVATSPRTFISSCLNILTAARSTGDASLFSALGQAIKHALGAGKISTTFFDSIMGGDPESTSEIGADIEWPISSSEVANSKHEIADDPKESGEGESQI